MIRIVEAALSDEASQRLSNLQSLVDNAGSYEARVSRASYHFALQNRASLIPFREVRAKLDGMCAGAKRCMYCEDSAADEVEHHHPKNLYPEQTFQWPNLLYACGPCNGPKSNQFAVIGADGIKIDVTRRSRVPILPPPVGVSALIDPRSEDPLQFLVLDIRGDTFRFTPHPLASPYAKTRAEYTIDILRLNARDYLLAARREAYLSYLARFAQYVHAKAAGEDTLRLERQLEAIKRMQHPTVLREMLRQAVHLEFVTAALQEAPELRLGF